MHQPKFRSQMTPVFLRHARATGLKLDPILREFGLPHDAAEQDELHLALGPLRDLHEVLAEEVGDDLLGLRSATLTSRGSYGLTKYGLSSAPTLRDALLSLYKYSRLFDELTEYAFDATGSEATIKLEIGGEPRCFGRQGNELILAFFVNMFTCAMPKGWAPRRAWVATAQPKGGACLRDFLGDTELEFDCRSVGLAFDLADLDQPLRGANPDLREVLDEQVNRILDPARSHTDVLTRVCGRIRDALPHGVPRLEDLAAELAIAPRTLQRRLASRCAGSYADLIEEVRRQLAFRLLHDDALTLEDIALRLGYQGTNNFARAFRRWTGQPPGVYRVRVPLG